MQVCGQEFSDTVIERIKATVQKEAALSRYALSRRVCEWMDWRRPNGELKDMSCRVALLALHKRGLIDLPLRRREAVQKRQAASPAAAQEADTVSGTLSQMGKVTLVQVGKGGSKNSRLWTEIMEHHHYLGSGPLCGAQLRYLIHSERHGWLGGLAFSAAAWAVGARDRWIGWDKAARREHLSKVICNSRFLIMPHIFVPNLASHVLSLSVKRLPEDWLECYGEAPALIETYVEKARFRGVCYKASNWLHVGSTQGRGRQDRANKYGVPVKDVYLYPLAKDNTREQLCEGMQYIEPENREGLIDWAEEEFGKAELADERLRKRLLILARALYGKPQANIPQACGSKAATKAAYRFLQHNETTMEKLLRPHYEATWRRVKEHRVVLAAQDTTSLNYTTHPETEGLGVIGSKLDRSLGLLVHDTMAFSTEGTPLGLLDVQCWTRAREDFGKKHRRHELPIEQKESYKWLKSYQATEEAQESCDKTTIVSVGDREADIYELFELALKKPSGPKLLIRAARERLLAEGQGFLWEKMALEPVSGLQELRIPRRNNGPARDAKLGVSFCEVTLKAPKRKRELADVRLWAILAQEVEAPEGVEPLCWMLLSTVEVKTFEEAVEKLRWYALRWGIEVYHKTLKSGCKIEERQFADVNSIEACLALDMVVAWRIFYLTKLGRETPEVPCTVFFEDAEWKALVAFKTQKVIPPEKPPTLREAVHMVGSLGGHLGRKGDGNPGTKALWLGLQRLDDITETWKIMAAQLAPTLLRPIVSSKGYG